MDEERRKQTARRVQADHAIAMALQEQERAFTMLTTIESEEGEEIESSDENSDESYDENDYEYFQGNGFEDDDLDFLEGQDSNNDDDDDDIEEDDIDPDELSYEELIALGEFIGVEKRGLSMNQISTCLNPLKFQSFQSKTGVDRCVVCQIEYEEGESVVSLPCEHPYHSECISKWLQINKVCPICSTEASSPPKIAKTL